MAEHGEHDPYHFLNRELNRSAAVSNFAGVLSLTTMAKPSGQRCRECCHWSLPLNAPYIGRDMPAGAAMVFQEWIVWHHHIVLHQRLHERELLVS